MACPGGKSTVEDIRSLGGAYALADDLFQSAEFSSLFSNLTGIPNLLYDRMYVGGGTHENRPGQELDPHVDFNYHPHQGWHRRLNLIVYLNPEWNEDWGGSIEFHEDPWRPPEQNRIRRVVPLANRAILFETSERSWHGFEVIRQPPDHPPISRKSLAIYMYTKERPPAETAPAHATVYVERPLPFVLRPGDSTEAQGPRVRKALTRRVQHIVRLQERERAFTRTITEQLRKLFSSAEPLHQQEIQMLEDLFRRQDALPGYRVVAASSRRPENSAPDYRTCEAYCGACGLLPERRVVRSPADIELAAIRAFEDSYISWPDPGFVLAGPDASVHDRRGFRDGTL